MEGPILYLLLLVLGMSFNLGPDIRHECGRFFKTLLKKSLEFIPSKGGSVVALNLGLVLLPVEVNPVLEERGCKGNTLGLHGTGRVKMILTLLAEVIILYMRVSIVQVGFIGLEGSFLGGEVCLAMFLALDEQF